MTHRQPLVSNYLCEYVSTHGTLGAAVRELGTPDTPPGVFEEVHWVPCGKMAFVRAMKPRNQKSEFLTFHKKEAPAQMTDKILIWTSYLSRGIQPVIVMECKKIVDVLHKVKCRRNKRVIREHLIPFLI